MIPIRNTHSYTTNPLSSHHEEDYPLIPFKDVQLKTDEHGYQLQALQSELARVRHALELSPYFPYMNLQDKGFEKILSSLELIPSWIKQVNLDNNSDLTTLPNDFSNHLQSLSLINNVNLKTLPASLPDGLSVDITRSGLSHDVIHAWQLQHPNSGVSFLDNNQPILAETVPDNSRDRNVRDRANWEYNNSREQQVGTDDYQPPAYIQENYDRDRYGIQYANNRAIARHSPLEELDGLESYSDFPQENEADQEIGNMNRSGSSGYHATALPSNAEASFSREMEESAIDYDDYLFDSNDSDNDERTLHEQTIADLNLLNIYGDQFDAIQSDVNTLDGVAHDPMIACVDHLGQKMAFWLGEEATQFNEPTRIAQQCANFLYALETEHLSEQPAQPVDTNELRQRLDEFALTLDRIKDTASFSAGTWETQAKQRQKVADLLRLMVTDKTLCATCLAAMKEAATTCPDALATEGLDMVEAMCTTARSLHENWTPEIFFRKMEQQIKRDKVRTQVGEITKRMKKEYGHELKEVIEKNHHAFIQFLPRPGKLLSEIIGEKHFVKKNGEIKVSFPDPDEKLNYTKEERKKYISLQSKKKIDDIEVLSLCQNTMQAKGLLSDVQAGLYTAMHHDNLYSDALNVRASELKIMSKNLSLSTRQVLKKMTTWEPWTDYLDRSGHLEIVAQDPELLRREKELASEMEELREKLTDFITDHGEQHPEGNEDYALLNNLISAIGTPVVSAHELLRRGGKNANAITQDDKEKYIKEGTERLTELETAQNAQQRSSQRNTANTTTNSSSRHSHQHREHRSSTNHTNRTRSTRTAPTENLETPPLTFETSRIKLLKEVLTKLKEIGESPYQGALYRKTEKLVNQHMPAPTAVHRRR